MLGMMAFAVAFVVITLAQGIGGIPLVLLCRRRLLAGSPVAWWTVGSLFAAACGWTVSSLVFRHDGDQLERGMLLFLRIASLLIAGIEWISGTALLAASEDIAAPRQTPPSGLIRIVSVAAMLTMLAITIEIALLPGQLQSRSQTMVEGLALAIDSHDYQQVRYLTPRVSRQSFAKRFGRTNLQLAIQNNDLKLFQTFWDLDPPNHPEFLVADIIELQHWNFLTEVRMRTKNSPRVLSAILKHAAIQGHNELCLEMLDQKVSTESEGGWSPLMHAIYHRHGNIARALIDRGANVNYVDSTAQPSTPGTALTCAVSRHDKGLCQTLLKAGADPRLAPPRGISALNWATRSGQIEFVQLLQSPDVDADETSDDKIKSSSSPATDGANTQRQIAE